MNRRRLLFGLLAALPLALFGGWASVHAAKGKSDNARLGCGCCCEDPSCPPGCAPDCPPDCDLLCLTDCCADPKCPPGCDAECPPDCLAQSKQCAASKCCPANCREE